MVIMYLAALFFETNIPTKSIRYCMSVQDTWYVNMFQPEAKGSISTSKPVSLIEFAVEHSGTVLI